MGCGGSKVDLDTFLTPQPKSDCGEIIPGLVGDVGHTRLKCANIFDLTYGTDPFTAAGRADAMKLQWNGVDAATVEVKAGTGGGLQSGGLQGFPKCWSSTVLVKDKSGQVVAQMEREDPTETKKHFVSISGLQLDQYTTTPAVVYCARPAHDGQVASPNGMFAWALIDLMSTVPEKTIVQENKQLANFGVFLLSSDGTAFTPEPIMLIVRGGAYAHIMNGDRSQNVGMASHTTITAAPGVDVLLMALLMLEFKLRLSSQSAMLGK